jgi:hypothetical protein
MRWDDLFEDLQARLEAAERASDDARVAELAEAELASTTVADRWRARRGDHLSLRLLDGTDRAGRVVDVSTGWIVIAAGERRSLVPRDAVALAWPLGGSAPEAGRIERALSLGHVLRALAHEGTAVSLHTAAGTYGGRLVRVGGDHCDLATEAGTLTVPWAALLCVDSL